MSQKFRAPSPPGNEFSWRRLKFAGGATVIVSFLLQVLLFDYWDERSAAIRTAILERAVIDKGAQLSELMYLIASTDSAYNDIDTRPQKIEEAARKRVFSTMMPILFSDSLVDTEKVSLSNDLLRRSASVQDYVSFTEFLTTVNDVDAEFAPVLNDQLTQTWDQL